MISVAELLGEGQARSGGNGVPFFYANPYENASLAEVTYYLHDHLGNTRVTYSTGCKTEPGGTPIRELTLVHAADYHPYGTILREWRNAEAASFRVLNQMNLETSRAWRIRETFNPFWTCHYAGAAQRFFNAWANNAMRSRLDPVKKVVGMLRRHLQGLLNYSRHRITHASAEGFNSAIQLIKTNARGFRNPPNYRARILFHCG